MKLTHKAVSIPLVVLTIAAIYGLFRTGGGPAGNGAVAVPPEPEQAALVDQSPLITAQGLVRMPTSAVELPSAQSALELADHEMDLAFALGMLDATQHPPKLTTDAKQVEARLQEAEDALASVQSQVAQITSDEA